MMQQIASKQPESAASKLPLEVKVVDSNKSAFHEALDLHQQGSHAKNMQQIKEDATNKASEFTGETKVNSDKIAGASNDKDIPRADLKPTNNDRQLPEAKTLNKDDNDNSLVNKKAKMESSVEKEIQDAAQEKATAKTANDSADDQKRLNDASIQKASNNQDFDFVSYVSKVAEFASGKDISDLNAELSLDDGEISGHAIKIFDDLLAVSDRPNNDKATQELTTLEINNEDLQLLLELHTAQTDGQQLNMSELSAHDQEKMQALLASLLMKLRDDSGEKANNNVQFDAQTKDELLALDQTLLTQTIEISTGDIANQTADANFVAQNVTALSQSNGQVLNGETKTSNAESEALLGTLQSSTSKNEKAQPTLINNQTTTQFAKQAHSNETSALSDIESASAVKAGLLNKESAADAKLLNSELETDNKLAKILQAPTELTNKPLDPNKTVISIDTSKSPLQTVLALEEDTLQAAMTNLKDRLENTMQALKSPEKGNEFIAALQAGVKEFKQQLSQGREPGLDLNALAEKALSSVAIESDQAIKLKIEDAVQQVNTVLNLANSLNIASSQLQATSQNNSNVDINSNISLLEGTKIANGLNVTANANANGTALNQQAAIDRAINIFKADGQQQLTEKVRWMVNAKNATAEIRLDPPDLGGMQIKVNLSGDNAQVNFTVQSNAAKEALDQAVPRLREMLQEQGIDLGESSVEQGNDQQQYAGDEQGHDTSNSNGFASERQELGINGQANDNEMTIETPIINQRIHSNGIAGIDYYA